jgi:hypothetical protein
MPDKVLIMNESDPNTDPRPKRIIEYFLERNYNVTVLSLADYNDKRVKNIRMPGQMKNLIDKAFIAIALILRFYRLKIWHRMSRKIINLLAEQQFNIIVCEDLELLPYAVHIQSPYSRILFDAREYYPRNYEDIWLWKFIFQGFNRYLCRHYLNRCHLMMTVSEGLAIEYKQEYGILPEVLMSLPDYTEKKSSSIEKNKKIRIVHHGNANPSRRIEAMIEMMAFLNQEKFSLDLYLVNVDDKYYNNLQERASKYTNISIKVPVPFSGLNDMLINYDIGLFLVPPATFNLKHCMPNKLFEFIQAGLLVAIGPSTDMAKLVKKYQCGIISADFRPESLAGELKKLTVEDINSYKKKTIKASKELNFARNKIQLDNIIQKLK